MESLHVEEYVILVDYKRIIKPLVKRSIYVNLENTNQLSRVGRVNIAEDTCRILASDNLTQVCDLNTSSSYCLKKLTKFLYHDNLTSTSV